MALYRADDFAAGGRGSTGSQNRSMGGGSRMLGSSGGGGGGMTMPPFEAIGVVSSPRGARYALSPRVTTSTSSFRSPARTARISAVHGAAAAAYLGPGVEVRMSADH